MKKLLLSLVLLTSIVAFANAQGRSLGARVGYGIEFSYQQVASSSNMFSLEVGLPGFNTVHAAATYDWIFPISAWKEAGAWNWYAGVGAGAGVGIDAVSDYKNIGNLNVGVAGRIGVEYIFDFPLGLSIDYRPVIGPYFDFNGDNKGVGFYGGGMNSAAISVRYMLGK